MGYFHIIQCIQPVGLLFGQLVNALHYYLCLVFAPYTRVSQVLSQQRSCDSYLTLGAEYIFVLSILSDWCAYLDLFLLGTMSSYFLWLTFPGLSVLSQCFTMTTASRFLCEVTELLKTHQKVPETSFAFWAQNEKRSTTLSVLFYYTVSSLSYLLFTVH